MSAPHGARRQPSIAAEEDWLTLIRMSPGRDRDELNGLLDEQLDFLRTSADAFDGGALPEYKRIALVRVLLHDTSQSHSLLEQLGGKAGLRFWDTRHRPVAEPGFQVLEPHDWPTGMVGMRAELTSAPNAQGQGSWRYFPMLGSDSERSQSRKHFEAWWRDSIIELRSGETFSRGDFVLGIANKEGGAHVDPHPKLSWVVLRDQAWDDAAGMVDAYGQLVPVRDLVPAVVRQIGYEASETLAEQGAMLA